MKKQQYNSYGESLDSTPDFFLLKRRYEEDLLINSVDNLEENLDCTLLVTEKNDKFDVTKISENLDIELIKESKTNGQVKSTQT